MNVDINDKKFKSIVLEINNSLDRVILSLFKENKTKKYTTVDRKLIAYEVYYKFIHREYSLRDEELYTLFWSKITENELEKMYIDGLNYIKDSCNKSNKTKEHFKNLIEHKISITDIEKYYKDNSSIFNKYVFVREKDKDNLQIIRVTDKNILNYGIEYYLNLIEILYDKLNNYSHIAIIFDDNYTMNKSDIISKIIVFCENFKREYNFEPFIKARDMLINNLIAYLKENKYINYSADLETAIKDFYSCISYGFTFKDLFISIDNKENILIMQKMEYSRETVMCPICLGSKVGSNSYTKLLQKNFECRNEKCICKSKSLRGKRYNYFSAKIHSRRFHLKDKDYVPMEVYKNFRKDIFENKVDIIKGLVHLYTFSDENILLYDINCNLNDYRELERNIYFYKSYLHLDNVDSFSSLPIIQLMQTVIDSIKPSIEDYSINNKITIKNCDSTNFLYKLDKNEFDIAITSPPYYNLRAYSKWDNLIFYYIDMIINSKYLYDKILDKGYYSYNISDIVDIDKVYSTTNMSKKRIALNSYSVIFFKLIGWNLIGNLIWYKGEVQSKRNLAKDLIGYNVNPINCYEHLYFFTKNKECKVKIDEIKYICPVMKINNSGNNILGHTAPYPIKLVENIKIFCNEKSTIIDPFLGSGTTLLWAKQNNYRGIGIELNADYFELAEKMINKEMIN